ncbi:MAG: cell division protein FtsQ/DivIB [Actinomycetota bacterium]
MSRTAPSVRAEVKERVRTDPRISRRRKAVARTRRRRAIGSTAFLIGLAVLVWIAFWSPVLNVRRIDVVGDRRTSAGDVRAAAAIDGDDNLLLVSTSDVAARVRALPWVRKARVDRRLPGTVRIKIVERRPAMVLTSTAGTWTIDARGRVLDEGAAGKGLPTLTGTEYDSAVPGDRIETESLLGALKVWRELPRRIRGRVAAIFAPTLERISFALDDQTIVRYGRPESIRGKNAVLISLLRTLAREGRRVAYVDVRVPTNPALGPPVVATLPTPGVTPAPTP